ncbi:dienelactone hydrolase family protein [Nitrosomonas sp.]|uniref:alpha/beta hydrolase n=1 Tax=Nitrosomonas sp. TaxID=42353 RepID=UPI0025EF667D|nr:dienelactone hydrolase family protein [Nitrosomonas sp.]MCC6915851.1 dienelactone hydrolase family protein [Nitrosomonas sp.]
MPDNSFQLAAIDITTGDNPLYTVIWMHGLGADGNDFVPVVQTLDLPAVPVRFLFPHAPLQPVTINGGYTMRAWYDIRHTDLIEQEDEAGLYRSQHAITALIEREHQRGTPSDHVILAGFSQGAAMALQTGLRYPGRLAGIIALSGYLPLAHKIAEEAHTAGKATPVFMAHGNEDPIVPIALAHTSLQLLRKYHYSVTWHEYPMEHSVCNQELADISRWLKTLLK